jgi:hypothetical protein
LIYGFAAWWCFAYRLARFVLIKLPCKYVNRIRKLSTATSGAGTPWPRAPTPGLIELASRLASMPEVL